MKIDVTISVTPKMVKDAQGNLKKAFTGHLGTHFDVMNKVFPLEYTELEGYVFDVSHIGQGEITLEDIDMSVIKEQMFVAFYTGFVENVGYGNATYFNEHPSLSFHLIDELLNRNIAIIGVDFAGVRNGKEHTPTDQLCADRGVFVVENLCNLKNVLGDRPSLPCHFHTYPMNFTDMTGLPCRVVVEV